MVTSSPSSAQAATPPSSCSRERSFKVISSPTGSSCSSSRTCATGATTPNEPSQTSFIWTRTPCRSGLSGSVKLTVHNRNQLIQLGGPGRIVYIDEASTLLHCSFLVYGFWIFSKYLLG
ncbi:hypothetical protein RvY_04582-1 [Ramazzottius varieornatus]|uniref:Uncharacterized protein n=1 Tax=Ramazzottius varieornatus TaxID=947166 RepID=A0A1D1USR2_RAMVA|nr:hypothetical protein RvY_04582-1 [Ramazzottius varieornatus]